MTRTTRSLAAAAALVALSLGSLTACAPAVRDEGTSVTASTAPTATSSTAFACPSAQQVSALSAVPLSATSASVLGCGYGQGDVEIRIVHGAGGPPGVWTLAQERARAVRADQRVTPADDLARGAFLARSGDDCTVWAPAVDGVLTSVSASVPGDAKAACTAATATAAVMGTSAATARPVVSVVASPKLDEASLRVLSGSGTAEPRRVAGFDGGFAEGAGAVRAARRVDPLSAVVVFVSDGSDADQRSLQVLKASSAALSTAAETAPRARIVLVSAPVGSGTRNPTRLSADLRTASGVAGADWIAPAASEAAQLQRAANRIDALLR